LTGRTEREGQKRTRERERILGDRMLRVMEECRISPGRETELRSGRNCNHSAVVESSSSPFHVFRKRQASNTNTIC
jgi:hypothetical protein